MKRFGKGLAFIGVFLLVMVFSLAAQASEVKVGAGSYSTVLPSGRQDVQSTIYRTENVTGPMSSNDWWSSSAFLVHSERQYPHPLAVWNKAEGTQIYYPGPNIHAWSDRLRAGCRMICPMTSRLVIRR